MTDKKELEDVPVEARPLAEPPKRRPFLGANSRDSKGKALFPAIDDEKTFECIDVEGFTGDAQSKPSLILKDLDGVEYIRPLGKTNEYQLGRLGFKTAGEVVGHMLVFRMYETGSTGQYALGLEIIDAQPVK